MECLWSTVRIMVGRKQLTKCSLVRMCRAFFLLFMLLTFYIVDMLVYAIDNPAPSTVILITGDRDFAYALSILKLRQYHTVLVTLPDAHPSLTNQAKTCFDWVDSVVNSQAENARWTGRVLHNMPAYHLPLAHPSPCTLNPEDSSGPDTDTEECVDFAYHSMQMRRQLPLPPSPSVVRTKSGVDREGAISGIPTNKVVHSPPSEGASTAAVDSCSAYQDFGRTGSNLELNGEKTSEDSSCSGFSSDRPTTDLCFTKYEDKKRETLNKAQGPAFREILSSSSAVPPMEAEQVDADVPLPSAAGMQHISSSSSNTPPAGSHATSAPSPLPPIFVDLVRVLQRHRSKGIRRSFRSVVAKKIGTSLLLKEAGINSFHEFMTRAEEGSQYQEMT